MFIVSPCSWLCPIHWSQVLSRKRRCGWSSADRWCSNYIWVINNLIAFKGQSCISGLTVIILFQFPITEVMISVITLFCVFLYCVIVLHQSNHLISCVNIASIQLSLTSGKWVDLMHCQIIISKVYFSSKIGNSRVTISWHGHSFCFCCEGNPTVWHVDSPHNL